MAADGTLIFPWTATTPTAPPSHLRNHRDRPELTAIAPAAATTASSPPTPTAQPPEISTLTSRQSAASRRPPPSSSPLAATGRSTSTTPPARHQPRRRPQRLLHHRHHRPVLPPAQRRPHPRHPPDHTRPRSRPTIADPAGIIAQNPTLVLNITRPRRRQRSLQAYRRQQPGHRQLIDHGRPGRRQPRLLNTATANSSPSTTPQP